jgi:hypothetical protein
MFDNDVTAAYFLLVHYKIVTVDVFLCPSGDQQRDFVFRPFIHDLAPISQQYNFSDKRPYSWSLSYALATPYIHDKSEADQEAEYRVGPAAPGDNAIAADRNDGIDRFRSNNPRASQADMELMNSRNHRGKGQNVLFNNGSVKWCNNPFVGVAEDNIYTRGGTFFPATSWRKHTPAHRYDSNLGPQLPLAGPVL